MKIKLVISQSTLALIVAALTAYAMPNLAACLSILAQDPADDGPEVAILRSDCL